jgi:hypothetical protein
MADIISFKEYKSDRSTLEQSLTTSGFADVNIKSNRSDVVMYVSDSLESGVLVFGFSLNALTKINQSEYLSWSHVVQVWEIIANPELGFDETYKKNAIQYIIKSLPGLKSWSSISKKMKSQRKDLTTHLFLEVDRGNINEPNSIHITQSQLKILDDEAAETIKIGTDNLA